MFPEMKQDRCNVGLWFYKHYLQLAIILCIQDTCMPSHKLPGISDTSALSVSIVLVFYLSSFTLHHRLLQCVQYLWKS